MDEDLTGVVVDRKGLSLHKVARDGQYKLLAKVLKQRGEHPVDINEVDGMGRTPLMHACMHGHERVAAYLLQMNAHIDIKDKDGYAAVHLAALSSGQMRVGLSRAAAVIRQIVKHGGEIDRKTLDGRTAVHVAVQHKCAEVITILRDQGGDINKFSTEGFNALYYSCMCAVSNRSVACINTLMKYDLDLNSADPVSGKTALHRCAALDLTDILRFLVMQGADVFKKDNHGKTIFHMVTAAGSIKSLMAILDSMKGNHEEGKDIALSDEVKLQVSMAVSVQDKMGNTPLHIACAFGYYDIVMYLLREGGDPFLANFSSIERAEMSDTGSGAEDEEEEDYDEDETEEAAAEKAAVKARETQVETGGGKTPYHVCCEVGHSNIFKAFVRRGLDTSEADSQGHTCLHFAAMNNDVEIAELQLECAPNADVLTNAGWSPLHFATAYDSLHMIVLLLDQGADANLMNLDGQTPLMLATRSRTRRAVQGLLKKELEREAADKFAREMNAAEERRKRMDEMYESARLQAVKQKHTKKISPRGSDDGKDEDDPLAKLKAVEKAKPEPTSRPKSRASSGRGDSASHSASRLANASPRSQAGSQAGGRTNRSGVSTFSLQDHPPGREHPVQRIKWEIGRRTKPVVKRIQLTMRPVTKVATKVWRNEEFVTQRKRVAYMFWRLKKSAVPLLTGESAPSVVSSYQGTTGFTHLPGEGDVQENTAANAGDMSGRTHRSQFTTRDFEGSQGGNTSRPSSRGSFADTQRGGNDGLLSGKKGTGSGAKPMYRRPSISFGGEVGPTPRTGRDSLRADSVHSWGVGPDRQDGQQHLNAGTLASMLGFQEPTHITFGEGMRTKKSGWPSVPKLRLPKAAAASAGTAVPELQTKPGEFLKEAPEPSAGFFGKMSFPKVRIPFRRGEDAKAE